MILAITGATGFVGREVLAQALDAGHRVRALARRPQPEREGVEWIAGDLASPGPLCDGADAVIHVAGVVNAPDEAGFVAGNVDGTRHIVEAAIDANIRRFVHVSSLSAREPQLSRYGASKREGERIVEASDLDWTIVRPSGVYGPGDTELRDLFRMAKLGVALLPPPGRVSLIHVQDLARLVLLIAERGAPHAIWEVDDGMALSHAELAAAVGRAVGQRVLPLPLPRPLLALSARVDRLLRGPKAKLTPDRVGYLAHPDWTADPARRPLDDFWAPAVPLDAGLAATARWYRDHGLL